MSTTTWEALAPVGIRPVKVALVIEVECVRTKSSADSISNFPALSGRVAVAIFPSVSPVLKKKGVSAAAGSAQRQPSRDNGIANRGLVIDMALVIDMPFLPATRPY